MNICIDNAYLPLTLDKLRISPEYAFLNSTIFRNHPIQYLTLAGSISYGTNNENSDIDIRGVFLESLDELLSIETRQKHVIDTPTDTTLYSLQEFIKLLCNCNPNVIELLGVNKEHVIYENDLIKSLKNNYSMFLSKKAYFSFAGYANAQLRRLQNALAHDTYDSLEKEQHILKTIQYELNRAESDFNVLNNQYKLYIDSSSDNESEIYIDINAQHVPLRNLIARTNQLHATIRNFDKLNHRNRKKDTNHLNKHAMHLIRLFFTGIDILQNGIIKTYRPPHELSLLRDIRNGLIPYNDIFKLADELDHKLKNIAGTCKLPDEPDMNKINTWLKNTYLNIYFQKD